MIHRRALLGGLLATLAAPAIIRTPGLLMPVKALPIDDDLFVHGQLMILPGPYPPGSPLDIPRLLLPGVRRITGAYASIPSQWTAVFAKAEMAL